MNERYNFNPGICRPSETTKQYGKNVFDVHGTWDALSTKMPVNTPCAGWMRENGRATKRSILHRCEIETNKG